MFRKIGLSVAALLAAVAIVIVVGCSNSSSPGPQASTGSADSPTKSATLSVAGEVEHVHKPGSHNGIIVPIGKDNYHAEAVFEKGGQVRVYILGQDEMRVQEVEAQPLSAFAKGEGDMDATALVLRPEPQDGDTAGQTSRFVGHLPRELQGKKVEITVPSIRIGNGRFRFGFQNTAAEHGEAPAKVAGGEEKKLYLTPGGKYTEADIQANGHVTASEKFKGLKAEHDLKPKPGEKICPITLTKANPKFSWIVGGKTYEFCCPPCVDEFVQMAKEKPDEVKEPDAYRNK
jgi:hypothetical protein